MAVRAVEVALGEVCSFVGGGTPAKNNPAYFGGGIPWATVRDLRTERIVTTEHTLTDLGLQWSSAKLLPSGAVVIATRVGLGKVCIVAQQTAINQDLRGILPRDPMRLNNRYLFWWLKSVAHKIEAAGTGATVQGVTQSFISSLRIPLPPLAEQESIVTILDDAIEAIATAAASISQSRQLCKLLTLASFSEKLLHEDTERVRLGDLIDIAHGYAFSGTNFQVSLDEKLPIVLTPGNYLSDGTLIFSAQNTKRLTRSDVDKKWQLQVDDLTIVMTDLSAKMNILGLPAFVNRPNVLHNQRIGKVIIRSSRLETRFLFYALQLPHIRKQIRSTATGTMVRHTAPERILRNSIPLPSLERQRIIVRSVNGIALDAKELDEAYLSKLAHLNELKAALLARAFSGKLFTPKALPLTTALIDHTDFTTPDQVANIIAFAHRCHGTRQQELTFGHKKTQKTLHFIEAVGGVELGRRPYKDAAGPNDFRHMLAAERWAKANSFFEFVKDGKRYSFKKLAKYAERMRAADAALAPIKDRLERATALIVDLDSTKAEVLATVHAAWNNLIIDGEDPTEEAILRAARDEWHSDKLLIPMSEFRQTICEIRKLGIVPNGSAKRVGEPRLL